MTRSDETDTTLYHDFDTFEEFQIVLRNSLSHICNKTFIIPTLNNLISRLTHAIHNLWLTLFVFSQKQRSVPRSDVESRGVRNSGSRRVVTFTEATHISSASLNEENIHPVIHSFFTTKYLLPNASEGQGKAMFSVCLPPRGRGTPASGPRCFYWSLVPGPFQGVPQPLVPGPFTGLWSLPLSRRYPLVLAKVLLGEGGYPCLRRGVPLARLGVPPAPSRTGYVVGGTPLAVSRRRTFLFCNKCILEY